MITKQSAGGTARANKLSPERRSEIARQAITARWSKRISSNPTQIIPKIIPPGDLISRSSALTVLEALRKQTATTCAYSQTSWTTHHSAIISLIQQL